jgi:hypothetical protein
VHLCSCMLAEWPVWGIDGEVTGVMLDSPSEVNRSRWGLHAAVAVGWLSGVVLGLVAMLLGVRVPAAG